MERERFKSEEEKIAEIEFLIQERKKAQEQKNFEEVNKITEELKKRGVRIFDTTEGPRWEWFRPEVMIKEKVEEREIKELQAEFRGLAEEANKEGKLKEYKAWLGVGLSKEAYPEGKVIDYIKWISKKFKECQVVIWDTPRSFNSLPFFELQASLQDPTDPTFSPALRAEPPEKILANPKLRKIFERKDVEGYKKMKEEELLEKGLKKKKKLEKILGQIPNCQIVTFGELYNKEKDFRKHFCSLKNHLIGFILKGEVLKEDHGEGAELKRQILRVLDKTIGSYRTEFGRVVGDPEYIPLPLKEEKIFKEDIERWKRGTLIDKIAITGDPESYQRVQRHLWYLSQYVIDELVITILLAQKYGYPIKIGPPWERYYDEITENIYKEPRYQELAKKLSIKSDDKIGFVYLTKK